MADEKIGIVEQLLMGAKDFFNRGSIEQLRKCRA